MQKDIVLLHASVRFLYIDNELYTNCRQLKLYSEDRKKYLNDVIDEVGMKRESLDSLITINEVTTLIEVASLSYCHYYMDDF